MKYQGLFGAHLNDPPAPATTTKKNYDVSKMTLAEMLTVMLDHQMSFKQMRDMTFEQIVEVFERINAGDILTFTEDAAAKKAAIQAARDAYRNKRG